MREFDRQEAFVSCPSFFLFLLFCSVFDSSVEPYFHSNRPPSQLRPSHPRQKGCSSSGSGRQAHGRGLAPAKFKERRGVHWILRHLWRRSRHGCAQFPEDSRGRLVGIHRQAIRGKNARSQVRHVSPLGVTHSDSPFSVVKYKLEGLFGKAVEVCFCSTAPEPLFFKIRISRFVSGVQTLQPLSRSSFRPPNQTFHTLHLQ